MDKDSDEDNEGTKMSPKKLKYFMLMRCGTEDGCHHLIFKQENGL